MHVTISAIQIRCLPTGHTAEKVLLSYVCLTLSLSLCCLIFSVNLIKKQLGQQIVFPTRRRRWQRFFLSRRTVDDCVLQMRLKMLFQAKILALRLKQILVLKSTPLAISFCHFSQW